MCKNLIKKSTIYGVEYTGWLPWDVEDIMSHVIETQEK